MMFLKQLRLTVRLWMEMKSDGYTFDDCWVEAGDILSRTEPWKKWYNEPKERKP